MAAPAPVLAPTASPDLDTWLSQLPADAHAAVSALRGAVYALASEPLAATDRLAALERMRAVALAALPEQRKRYLGKPIPLADHERQAWEDHVGLWQAFYFGYALCGGAGVDIEVRAALGLRALDSLGRAIREHACACRTVPASLWKELNTCYRSAEDCLLEDVAIPDSERPGSTGTCKRAYLTTLLHAAASLFAVPGAQLPIVEQWLASWTDRVSLRPMADVNAPTSALAIDLAGDTSASLVRDVAATETIRYLDTHELAPRLRDLATCLRAGTSAPELDTAQHLPRAALERLLTHLYIQWCSAGSGRHEERRSSTTRAQVALNMHAVHFQVSGRAFRQPGLRYTREEEHDLATFGHITDRTEQRLLTGRSAALEPWELVDPSASGVLGMCRKPGLANRLEHGQLLAMRTSSIDPVILGTVQRLRVDTDGSFSIGVRLIRGEVRGVAVRLRGDPTQKYERALLIEADSERRTPAHLILPAKRYAPGTAIEIYANRGEIVTVDAVVESGPDFDRVTFVRK